MVFNNNDAVNNLVQMYLPCFSEDEKDSISLAVAYLQGRNEFIKDLESLLKNKYISDDEHHVILAMINKHFPIKLNKK